MSWIVFVQVYTDLRTRRLAQKDVRRDTHKSPCYFVHVDLRNVLPMQLWTSYGSLVLTDLHDES